MTVEAASPSAADQARAAALARRDGTLAAAMEKERMRQEAQAAGTFPAPPAPAAAPTAEPHKWPEKAATRKLDVFTAVDPKSVKPKKKAEPAASKRPKEGTSHDTPGAAGKLAHAGKPAGALAAR